MPSVWHEERRSTKNFYFDITSITPPDRHGEEADVKTKMQALALALILIGAALTMAQQTGGGRNVPLSRPKGPCDIYAAAGDPCVAAHSTTRALYASYDGPLYQVLRQSDGKTLNI